MPPLQTSRLMAVLALAVLLLAMAGHSSATWCVCKDGPEAVLQKALDYACGAGADCDPIRQNGPCYQPNSVKAHCSYAVNSYFQRKGQSGATCEFGGTATMSSSDPSTPGCLYPASASAAGTTTMPSTMTPSSSTSTTTSPYGTTSPSNGVLGGNIGTGIGPTGAGSNNDVSHGGPKLLDTYSLPHSTKMLFLALMLLLG